MGSLPDIPELTHLERIGPKGYLRYVFPFQLKNGYDIEEITGILRHGFDAAKHRLPVMDCEAVPDKDCQRKSMRQKGHTCEVGEAADLLGFRSRCSEA